MKLIRRILLTVLLVSFGLLIAMATVLVFVDPADYKEEIEQLVLDQANVAIVLGDIEWSFYPHLGFRLSDVTVYQNPTSNDRLISLGEVRLSLAIFPLLAGQLIVQGIEVGNVSTSMIVDADGKSNWESLLNPSSNESNQSSQQKKPSKPAQVNSEQAQESITSETSNQQTSTDKQNSTKIPLTIEFVRIRDVQVSYLDQSRQLDIEIVVDSLDLDDFAFDQYFNLAINLSAKDRINLLQSKIKLNAIAKINQSFSLLLVDEAVIDTSAKTSLLGGSDQQVTITTSGQFDFKKNIYNLPFQIKAELSINNNSANKQKVEVSSELAITDEMLQAKATSIDAYIDYPVILNQAEKISFRAEFIEFDFNTFSAKSNKAKISFADLILNFDLDVPSVLPLKVTGRLTSNQINPRKLLSTIKFDDQPVSNLIPETANPQAFTNVKLEADFIVDLLMAKIKELRIGLDQTSLTGSLEYHLAENKIIADLAIDSINLDDYLPVKNKASKEQPNQPIESPTEPSVGETDSSEATDTESSKVNKQFSYSKEPILPLDLFRIVLADIMLKADHISYQSQHIENSRLAFINDTSQSSIQLNASAFAGDITLATRLNQARAIPRIDIDAKLTEVELAQALQLLSRSNKNRIFSGKSNLSTKLKLTGNSIYHWINSLSGSFSLSIDDGRIYGFELSQKLCSAIVQADGGHYDIKSNEEPFTSIEQLTMASTITRGKLDLTKLKLAIQEAKGEAKGSINLPTLDFRVPLELNITGNALDNRCEVNKYLAELEWPILCQGNLINSEAIDYCRPNIDLIISRTKAALQRIIDEEKDKAEQLATQLKAKIEEEKKKQLEEVEHKKSQLEEQVKDQVQDKLKVEGEKLKKSVEDQLKNLFK